MESRDATDRSLDVTPAQLRAARSLLGWSRDKAAEQCGIGWATLSRMERDESSFRSATMARVVRTFEANGIRFTRVGQWTGVEIAERGPEEAGPL